MYKVEIINASKDISTMSARDKIILKDLSNALQLNELVEGSENKQFLIKPDFWAELRVTNDKSSDGEYTNYVITDKDGVKYYTGSESFWTAFTDIMEELVSCGEAEGALIAVTLLPSKNRPGKFFLTCNLM